MLVPMICKSRGNHWIMSHIDTVKGVFVYDLMMTGRNKEGRLNTTLEMLITLDGLFDLAFAMKFGPNFQFANLPIECSKDIPAQDNGFDCGIYVMKFMEAFSNRESIGTICVLSLFFLF